MTDLTRYAAYKLCYVDDNFAYFTTADPTDVTGDDWNDKPYEHNAGTPYDWSPRFVLTPEYRSLVVAFSGSWCRPCDTDAGVEKLNSEYSVDEINAGYIPWLRTDKWTEPKIEIPAGTTLPDFCTLIKQGGGMFYLPAWDEETTDG